MEGHKVVFIEKGKAIINSTPGNWTAKRDFMTILGYMKDKKINPSILKPQIISAEKRRKYMRDY